MIDPAYVQTMARYNAWQNRQIADVLEPVPHAILILERRAFFGSILRTLSHLLWGDTLWMSRFDAQVKKPKAEIADSSEMVEDLASWHSARVRLDETIRQWAAGLKSVDLRGNLSFRSSLLARDIDMPMALCVTHFFNHQTHHRGQVHAMITAAGLKGPVTDLIFMPDNA